jgi:hypothetical protein
MNRALLWNLGTTGFLFPMKGGETCLKDFTQGVLEGLAYSRTLLKAEKPSAASAKIARRILEITEAAASDLEFRMRATA